MIKIEENAKRIFKEKKGRDPLRHELVEEMSIENQISDILYRLEELEKKK